MLQPEIKLNISFYSLFILLFYRYINVAVELKVLRTAVAVCSANTGLLRFELSCSLSFQHFPRYRIPTAFSTAGTDGLPLPLTLPDSPAETLTSRATAALIIATTPLSTVTVLPSKVNEVPLTAAVDDGLLSLKSWLRPVSLFTSAFTLPTLRKSPVVWAPWLSISSSIFIRVNASTVRVDSPMSSTAEEPKPVDMLAPRGNKSPAEAFCQLPPGACISTLPLTSLITPFSAKSGIAIKQNC